MIRFEPTLAELEHADLIRRLVELDVAYQFKHNLIQESAYSSLLRNDRRSLHLAAAHALESAYADELDANAALLAKHYAEAGDEQKTYHYARRAAEAARRVSAYAEALMQYDTAALLAPRMQISTGEFVELHQARGRTLELMGKYDDAKEAYNALYTLGQQRQDVQIELGALLPLATLQTFPNEIQNLGLALGINQKALELARASGDAVSETRALWNMVLYSYFSGKASDAVRYGKQGLEIADQYSLQELRAYILNDMSRALVTAGSTTDSLQALAEARAIWIEMQNLPMLADNLASSAEQAFVSGDIETFERFNHQAVELCQTIGNLWNLTYAEGTRMQFAFTRGDFNQVLACSARVKTLARASGFSVSLEIANVVLATMMGEFGAPDKGLEYLEREAIAHPFQLMDSWRFSTLSYLYMLKGDIDNAAEELARAKNGLLPDDLSNYGPIFVSLCEGELSLARQNWKQAAVEAEAMANRLRAARFKYLLPEILVVNARARMGLEQWDAAGETLNMAEEEARLMQDQLVLWQVLAYRTKLETRRGNSDAAFHARSQSRQVIEWIVDHAPDEYRVSFLARPLVEFVLSDDYSAPH